MSVLALIPARGHSKGLPRKCLKDLRGKPLIAWTIEAAKQAPGVDRVVVTTDSAEIAHVALEWGADVPFMRPDALAGDDTPTIDAVLHALSLLPDYEWLLLLQPTSPMRSSGDIEAILGLVAATGAPSAVSVCEAMDHPYWTYRRHSSHRLSPFTPSPLILRRQDLPPAFALNGALYLAKCEWIQENRCLVAPESVGYVMPLERSVDIDSELDWKWAEFLLTPIPFS